jgi:hypothetical protein
MISNKISLSCAEKAPSYTQAKQLSMRKAFYDHVKLRFLQQSAEYLGSTLSQREIEALLTRESHVRS